MARSRKKKLKESDLQGFQDLRAIAKLFKSLEGVGTESDKAGNRNLTMDQYCLMVLMWLYNPVIDSLGGLQQAGRVATGQQTEESPAAAWSRPGVHGQSFRIRHDL